MPSPVVVSARPRVCAVCPTVVQLESATTPHPGAPEMIKLPAEAWMGFVAGDTAPEMVVVCSTLCLHRLLWE